MVVRLLLLCVALALELSSAVFWRALDPQLMEELLALAACVLVALAMFSRCCCCCAPALSPLAGQWSLLIALLIVLSFASALSVPRALVASAALFVPAVTAPLSALLDSRHAPVTVVLALATSAAAMAGTGAHAELLAALDEHGSALALACSCAAAVAVQWAGVQRVLHARAPGARLRVGSGALVLAVLVRAAALLVLAVAVLFALSTLSDEARVRRASAELLVRSPRPDAALADIGGKLLVGDECARLPLASALSASAAPGGGWELSAANGTLTPCWHVPKQLTRCVRLPLGFQFCASVRALSLALVAAIFAVGTLALYGARFALIGALGAPALASVCVLARLGALALQAHGVVRLPDGGVVDGGAMDGGAVDGDTGLGTAVSDGGSFSFGSDGGFASEGARAGQDDGAAAGGGAAPVALDRRGVTLCACAAGAAVAQLLLALFAAQAAPPARPGARDERSGGRGASVADAEEADAGRGSRPLLATGAPRSDWEGRARANGVRGVRTPPAVGSAESEYELFKRWRQLRQLQMQEMNDFAAFLEAHAPPAPPNSGRRPDDGGEGGVRRARGAVRPLPLGESHSAGGRSGAGASAHAGGEHSANGSARLWPPPSLADLRALPSLHGETPPALGRAATTPAPTAPAAGRMADDHAHGAGDDGASPPAYEAVVRSASASGGGGGGRGGGGEDMRAGAPARWLSEPAASSGDGALSGDAEADHGVEAVLTHTCTRCGFATHGLTAMHQHALHCSLGGGARARAGGGGEEAEVMPMRLGMY